MASLSKNGVEIARLRAPLGAGLVVEYSVRRVCLKTKPAFIRVLAKRHFREGHVSGWRIARDFNTIDDAVELYTTFDNVKVTRDFDGRFRDALTTPK